MAEPVWRAGFEPPGCLYTQQVPEDYREAFIEAVCEAYLDQVPLCADGKAHVAMVLLEVEAEKLAKL